MNPFKKSFDENYVAVKKPSKNKKGYEIQHIYYGPWYFFDISDKERLSLKINLGAACVLDISVFLITASTENVLNYLTLVEVLGTLSLAFLLFQAIGVFQFCTAGKRMTRPQYKDITAKLRLAPPARLALTLAAGLSCVYYTGVTGFSPDSMYVTAGYLVCAALSAYIFLKFRKLPFSSERNRALEQYKSDPSTGELIEPPSKP